MTIVPTPTHGADPAMNQSLTTAPTSPHDVTTHPATLVRRAILASAGELDAALRSVATDDRRRQKALDRWFAGFAAQVRNHHELLDTMVVPTLSARGALDDRSLDIIADDHSYVDELLSELGDALGVLSFGLGAERVVARQGQRSRRRAGPRAGRRSWSARNGCSRRSSTCTSPAMSAPWSPRRRCGPSRPVRCGSRWHGCTPTSPTEERAAIAPHVPTGEPPRLAHSAPRLHTLERRRPRLTARPPDHRTAVRRGAGWGPPSASGGSHPDTGSPFARRPVGTLTAMSRTLSESESKQLLAGFGIPVAGERRRRRPPTRPPPPPPTSGSRWSPSSTATRSRTRPSVASSKLNIRDARRRAAPPPTELLAAATPDDGDVDVLVAPMIRGNRELIAGVLRDPQFGPTVMLGLGGILAEAVADVVFRPAPVDDVTAHEMIDQLGDAAPARRVPRRGRRRPRRARRRPRRTRRGRAA